MVLLFPVWVMRETVFLGPIKIRGDEIIMNRRPSWDSYFMDIARVVSSRATCLRRQVGAVIVLDRRLLTTGYNGVPTGFAHCREKGCVRAERDVPSGERHELCRGLHAEQNAIIQAALYGVKIAGSTLYCTHHPCVACAKMLVNAGIRRVVIAEEYPDDLARTVFGEAGAVVEIRVSGNEG